MLLEPLFENDIYHKEYLLKRLVNYSENINSTNIVVIEFLVYETIKYDSNKLRSAFYALCDDKCMKEIDYENFELLPAAFNYSQNRRIKITEKFLDFLWDVAKLILAGLVGALISKHI
jgi:hypothetical protein